MCNGGMLSSKLMNGHGHSEKAADEGKLMNGHGHSEVAEDEVNGKYLRCLEEPYLYHTQVPGKGVGAFLNTFNSIFTRSITDVLGFVIISNAYLRV